MTRGFFTIFFCLATCAAAWADESAVKISSALYYFGGDRADVSQRVQELVDQGNVFQADPASLEVDPKPGWHKQLKIVYMLNGQAHTFGAYEDQNISARLLREAAAASAPAPAVIIKHASYEFDQDKADVTSRVQALMYQGDAFNPDPETMGADPHPYWLKTLKIDYLWNSLPHAFSAEENRYVSAQILRRAAMRIPKVLLSPEEKASRAEERTRLITAAAPSFRLLKAKFDSNGAAIPQTLKLLPQAVEGLSKRYAGFRLVVDRHATAARLGVSNPESLDLQFFFFLPNVRMHWNIIPLQGAELDLDEREELRLASVMDVDDFAPKEKRALVLQTIPAASLVEGGEYLVWFSFDDDQPEPPSLSYGVAYTAPAPPDEDAGKVIADILRVLGLEPARERIGEEYLMPPAAGE